MHPRTNDGRPEADRPWYAQDNRSGLASFITAQMVIGAGWAALVFAVLILGFVVLRGIAGVLPPASQEAPDPLGSIIVAPAEGTRLG